MYISSIAYIYAARKNMELCGEQELVHSRQELVDDRSHLQTAIDNLKCCFRLIQWLSTCCAVCFMQ